MVYYTVSLSDCNAVSTWISFWHWVTYKRWRLLPKNTHVFCLTLKLCHQLLGFCPQPLLVWADFRFFLKGTVIPISFLWSLWHFASPNRLSHPVATKEVEKTFCWRACLPCYCKLCANNIAHGREAGHPPPSHGHHVSCFPIIIREVCFTLLFHFSFL